MDDTGTFYGSNQSRRQRQNAAIARLTASIEAERRWYRLWISLALVSGCLIGAGLMAAVGAWFK
jgi:hypothetical protein